MHKVGAILLASASLSSCGSGESQPLALHQQSWRLVKAEWWLLHSPYGMQINTENKATSFEYDESNEISHISSINLAPFLDKNAPSQDTPEENLLLFNSYRFFNASSSDWDVVEETLVPVTPDTQLSSDQRLVKLHTFQSWGDTSQVSRLLLGNWGGASELDPNFPAPSDFNTDSTDIDSDFPNITTGVPTTQRKYENGKVSQVLYFDSTNEKPFYRQVINYENNRLSNIQQARRVDSSDADTAWQNSVIYNYIYPTAATVIVEVTLESAIGEIRSFIVNATYEQADCGPITKERSLKMVPQPFPYCIIR